MSSQAERIRAFKLAQHARIQKQDDEEQWISSEELCTEGSSDEETHACIKTNQRKPKRNLRSEKRGISPLAQNPKPSEPISTYQTDARYLLPDINLTNRVAEKPSSSSMTDTYTAPQTELSLKQVAEMSEAAKSCSLSEEDVYDDEEIEKMIQWRPKRGSIKLPDFDEGRSPSLDHVIFEARLFYEEMSMNIRSLKMKSYMPRHSLKNETNVKTDFVVDPNMNRLMQSVTNLDKQISNMDLLVENEKYERQCVQKELCSTYSNTDLSSAHSKGLQEFLDLCKLEVDNEKDESDPVDINNNKSNAEQVKRKIKKEEPTFVKRNIQLASKHNPMADLCLTDEEKLQLDALLSDLDSDQYNVTDNKIEPTFAENEESEQKTQPTTNYFKLEDEDMLLLSNLDCKLNDIIQSYNESDDRDAVIQHKEIAALDADVSLETTDKQGKLWKHFHMQKRLETIDINLESISLMDLADQKKQEDKDLLEQDIFEDIKNNLENT